MNESFRYWQGRKIEHASSVSNLTLTLAIGAIGFGLTLLEKKPADATWSPCVFIASMFLLLLSAAFAIMGMVSRLEDLGATAQAARLREGQNRDEARLVEEREIARYAGERTKAYLVCQMITFVVGAHYSLA